MGDQNPALEEQHYLKKKIDLTISITLLNQHVKVGRDANAEVIKHILDYIFRQGENTAMILEEFNVQEVEYFD